MAGEHFLVTGGSGCIGAWVVRRLVRQSVPVTLVSASGRLERLKLLMSPAEMAELDVITADINDLATLEDVARRRQVSHVIHLAALQFPFCAADPVAGARVNVQGTLTMFELVRRLGLGRLVYASSAAVYGPKARYPDEVLAPDAELYPTSHYGVFKAANEHGARVAWDTQGIASIGLRPHSVYGPGRDQGVTSKPTVAMIAAAAEHPYHIDFGGRYQFQFAADAAEWFIAAARSNMPGAAVYSLPGPAIGVDQMVAAIEDVVPSARGRITYGDRVLPFPTAFDGTAVQHALGARPETPLADGVRQTIDLYRAALRDGRIGYEFVERVLGTQQ